MKTLALLLVVSALTLNAAENLVLEIYQNGNLGGRIQHDANPGQSSEGVKHISKLPMDAVAVGPTQNSGVSMAFLMAFETTPEFRQHMAADGTVRLVLNVVSTLNGGAPDDLNLALLNMGTVTNPDHYPQFGAFNKAVDFQKIDTIDANPEIGLLEVDVSKALQASTRQPSADEPLVWFVVYLPVEKLDGVEPRHVVFGGKPRLVGIR